MQSEQIDKIAAALAKAQGAMQNPPRNREVRVSTKTGGSYAFKYATLDAIMDAVRQPLSDNGLSYTQTLANGDGKYRLVTKLLHESGQFLVSETPLLLNGGGNQEFGSALSYMRRYSLTAMLGIAADEDDDANSADGNTITDSKTKTVRRGEKAPEQKPAGPTLEDRRKRFSLALDHAPHTTALDALWKQGEALLAELLAANPEDYNYLSLARDRKRNELMQKDAA